MWASMATKESHRQWPKRLRWALQEQREESETCHETCFWYETHQTSLGRSQGRPGQRLKSLLPSPKSWLYNPQHVIQGPRASVLQSTQHQWPWLMVPQATGVQTNSENFRTRICEPDAEVLSGRLPTSVPCPWWPVQRVPQAQPGTHPKESTLYD